MFKCESVMHKYEYETSDKQIQNEYTNFTSDISSDALSFLGKIETLKEYVSLFSQKNELALCMQNR